MGGMACMGVGTETSHMLLSAISVKLVQMRIYFSSFLAQDSNLRDAATLESWVQNR
jgi:hypothetical protein